MQTGLCLPAGRFVWLVSVDLQSHFGEFQVAQWPACTNVFNFFGRCASIKNTNIFWSIHSVSNIPKSQLRHWSRSTCKETSSTPGLPTSQSIAPVSFFIRPSTQLAPTSRPSSTSTTHPVWPSLPSNTGSFAFVRRRPSSAMSAITTTKDWPWSRARETWLPTISVRWTKCWFWKITVWSRAESRSKRRSTTCRTWSRRAKHRPNLSQSSRECCTKCRPNPSNRCVQS